MQVHGPLEEANLFFYFLVLTIHGVDDDASAAT